MMTASGGGAPAPSVDRWGIGLHYGATNLSMPILDVSLRAAALGFDSMFVPEHTHIPIRRATPFPGGGEMPDRYNRLWDPLVALSFVAARTDLVVGTCVGLPGEHDPIAMAKAVATLDQHSQGRFVMGFGFGWNHEEFADHGFPPNRRRTVVAEKIAVMKALWADEPTGFSGTHVGVEPSWAWPKPHQRPHPPVLLGGLLTPSNLDRITGWCDGWIPMTMQPAVTLEADLALLRSAWNEAGRDPAGPHVMVMQAPEPLDRLVEAVEFHRSMGVRRVLIDIPSESAAVLEPLLDEVAAILDLHRHVR